MSGDPFLDPRTGVFRNRLGLRDRAELAAAEKTSLVPLLAEINALHPFREGNGRTQRAFLSQLARDAGFRLDWATVDRDGNI